MEFGIPVIILGFGIWVILCGCIQAYTPTKKQSEKIEAYNKKTIEAYLQSQIRKNR